MRPPTTDQFQQSQGFLQAWARYARGEPYTPDLRQKIDLLEEDERKAYQQALNFGRAWFDSLDITARNNAFMSSVFEEEVARTFLESLEGHVRGLAKSHLQSSLNWLVFPSPVIDYNLTLYLADASRSNIVCEPFLPFPRGEADLLTYIPRVEVHCPAVWYALSVSDFELGEPRLQSWSCSMSLFECFSMLSKGGWAPCKSVVDVLAVSLLDDLHGPDWWPNLIGTDVGQQFAD